MTQTTESAISKKDEFTSYFSLRAWWSKLIKRAFDFIIALIGLILLSPLFVFIAILIKRDSPGPVFYWGPCTGRHGVIFKILKFRTMYETQKSYQGTRITCKEDDRITPFGRWLCDTRLNELPQLWNVLIGEMSLVGPRPEDPSISKTWTSQIAGELLSVRPGVTSPASVLYRDEENMLHTGEPMRQYLRELSPDKTRLDQLYIRYRSFWLDLDVLLWNFLMLVSNLRAHNLKPLEETLFWMPISRWVKTRKKSLAVCERVLIVGAGDAGLFTAWSMRHSQESHNFKVEGFVDDDFFGHDMHLGGISVLGKYADIPNIVEKHDIGAIIFAGDHVSADERESILKICSSTQAQIVTSPNILSLTRSQHSKSKRLMNIIDEIGKKYFILSIAHPRLLSKRFESPFLVQIHFEELNASVKNRIKEIIGESFDEHVYDTKLKFGLILSIKLFSPDITFPEPIVKKLDSSNNSMIFLGKPLDTCQPGEHKVVLSILDNKSSIEYQSETFSVKVVDFSFDHISRPFLSRVSTIVLGIGSLAMFMLTFLEQVDKTVGLTSGTAAGVLAAVVYTNFYNLYQRIRPNSL